jgi:FlaA1/EpsC-like NDP-sugar epimerase
VKKIPIRQGEKFHETLISEEEANFVYTTKHDYIIQNQGINSIVPKQEISFSKAKLKSAYNSNTAELLTKNELKKLILEEGLLIK